MGGLKWAKNHLFRGLVANSDYPSKTHLVKHC
jgi:hypothetical protein